MRLATVLALLLTLISGPARAESDEFPSQDDVGIHPLIEAGYFRKSDEFSGAAFGLAAVGEPFRDRWIFAGPRLTATVRSGSRWDFAAGGEATVWVMNALGPGVGIDWVALRSIDGENHPAFRLEPNLSVRVKRVGDKGAVALRVSGVYDSACKWALLLGLTLQLGGVNP
jgi:hypothetical protein